MKNYLLDIDNELQNYYKQFIKVSSLQLDKSQIVTFTDNVIALLDYYIEPIFNSGKKVIAKRLNTSIKKNDFTDKEQEFINNYKTGHLNQFKHTLIEAITNCFEDRESNDEFYEQLVEVVVANCIKLFKYAQLSECLNNNIDKVNIATDNDSCSVCKTKSQFKQSTAALMNSIDDLHPFCKFSILINLDSQIENIKRNLQISIPELITDKEFKVVDDISLTDEFINILNNKYEEEKASKILEQTKGTIMTFEVDDLILVSKDHLNKIDYIVTRALLKDKLMQYDLSWWKETYNQRIENKHIGDNIAVYSEPFISYIAEQNYESYFLESAIYYILNPESLKLIDQQNYNQLQEHIFHGEIKF